MPTQTRLAYYATPEEQAEWIREYLRSLDAWALRWSPVAPNEADEAAVETVTTETMKHDTQFFLGTKSLHLPVWREVPDTGARRPDLLGSGALQMIIGGTDGSVIYEGFVGIMQPGDYSNAGVDGARVLQQFRTFVGIIRRFRDKRSSVVKRSPNGAVTVLRDVIITQGAAARVAAGFQLKQIPTSRVDLHVQELV